MVKREKEPVGQKSETLAAYKKRLKEGSQLRVFIERAIKIYGGHVLLSPERLHALEKYRSGDGLLSKDIARLFYQINSGLSPVLGDSHNSRWANNPSRDRMDKTIKKGRVQG